MRVLAQRHMIDGRWCDVKIPNSKEGQVGKKLTGLNIIFQVTLPMCSNHFNTMLDIKNHNKTFKIISLHK